MPTAAWRERAQALAGSPAAMRLPVTAVEWLQIADELASASGQLLAMWATPMAAGSGNTGSASGGVPARDAIVRAVVLQRAHVLVLELVVPQHAQS
jgi:hypothetical protein